MVNINAVQLYISPGEESSSKPESESKRYFDSLPDNGSYKSINSQDITSYNDIEQGIKELTTNDSGSEMELSHPQPKETTSQNMWKKAEPEESLTPELTQELTQFGNTVTEFRGITMESDT
jgi:hypothetical protein